MRLRSIPFKKITSSAIAAALIVTTPGFGCWDALARVVGKAPAAMTAMPGGLTAGVGVQTSPALAPGMRLGIPGGTLALEGALPVVEGLTAAPAAPGAAVSAAAVVENAAVSGARIAVPSAKAAPAAPASRAKTAKSVALQQTAVSAAVEALPEASRADAHGTGASIMNLILGRESRARSKLDTAVPVAGRMGTIESGARNGLNRSRGVSSRRLFSETPSVNGADLEASAKAVEDEELPAPRGWGGAIGSFLLATGRMAVGAGAVVGLNAAATWLLPSIFGAMPVAAVWAVSSGAILLPAALYARYRLGLRNSARLKPVKGAFDLMLGAFLGSAGLAAASVYSGAFIGSLSVGLPALAGIAGFGAVMAVMSKTTGASSGGWIDAVLTWASLNLLAPFIGSVSASPLALGGLLGLAALPAITTIAFFLGRIIVSAESGRPFAVPGGMKQIRFPAYTWVMTGVVFALLTGYAPVWTNVAFGLWMFLGKTRIFNTAWAALGVWAAITGFSAPVTFLFLAFAPERAAMGTEWLLGKLLKRGPPAPSTKAEPLSRQLDKPERWPKFNYWLKTGLALGSLAAFGFVLSEAVLGVFALGSFGVNIAIAGALAFVPFWFSKWLIKKMMKAQPMSEESDPEVYGIMRELREEINEQLKAKGKKEIPMPEMVNVPMPVPNAFATGRSPHSAMVGVTLEMKDMTLNPERLRDGLIRLVKATDGSSKSYAVFRRAIRGSIPDVAEDAAPMELVAALEKAELQDLKKLGVRALRGVMGHEFKHVMHRDMLLGAVTGTISQGIAFTAYGVLWAVGHAEAVFKRLWNALFKSGEKAGRAVRGAEKAKDVGAGKSARSIEPHAVETEIDPYHRQAERVRPQVFEPVTTGAAATGILSLVKVLMALWAPVIATLIQMASSRTREGHADEGGALLTKDPESLALGLGLLTSWRPPTGFFVNRAVLPLVAAQAHIMTVNPIQQLKEAEALPKTSKIVQMAVGKEDNFFFNLFITHPDTTQRIERLFDMAEVMARERAAKAPAPSADRLAPSAPAPSADKASGASREENDRGSEDRNPGNGEGT
jgi:Zn-dependent protease with chaperone function